MGTPFSDPIHETDLTAGVCIVAPQGETYQSAARDLAAVLSGTGCSDVEVLPDDTQALAGRHAIALGNMMDNALLRELYFRAYDFTDRAWPGPGGWAIRTVPYSLPDVGHAIVVGVSQGDDVLEASKALAGAVADGGPVMPTQYRVYQGQWADLYEGPAQDRLEKGVEDLEAGVPFGAGDWTYMRSISEIGVLAAQTGSGDLIRTFCRLVSNFVRIRWFERDLPDPPCIHGFLRALLLPFAAIEHHPGIPSSLREETLESLLGIYRSAEGAGNLGFLAHVGTERVRQNHQTRSGLDLFYGGRYFHQVHGLMEGLAWMKLADVFFAPQMASNKPVCDSWGHQWAASLCNTADYALACGRADYFTSTPYLEGVDRALIAHSLLEGGPVHYFLVAAAATGNDEYLWPCGVSGEYQLVKRALRGGEEPLRCWVTGRAAVEPRRLSGMGVAPLSRLFYDSIEEYGGFAPEGVYRRDVPYEKAFDKVWFRSGWSETDDYLLLDGISGGSHSYQDGNCIVRFTSRGRTWFGGVPAAGRLSPGSVREHVGVNIAVDGAGPGCEPRYAALRYVGRGDRFSASGTSMSYPGLADWHRHIVHATDLWFLVVDEIRAKCDGEFLVEAQWHLVGEVALIGDTLHSTQGDAALTMRHAGSGVQDLMPAVLGSEKEGTRWVQRSLGRLREGEGVRFATLFWADRRESVRDYSLSLDSAGYCIADERGSVSVALAHGEEAPELRDDGATLPTPGPVADAGDPTPFQVARREWAPAWRARCEGALTSLATWEEGCCASDAAGGIAAFDREGRLRWRASVQGAVRAVLALQDGGVVAGGDGETVYRLDASGRKVWSQKLVWQPMNWDNWTRMNVQVLSLASGDIDGDGNDEILAGCADRHIYAFDDQGKLLWRSNCQWGPPVCMQLARPRDGEGMQVLVGMADPAIHACIRVYDATGTCVRTYSRPDIMSWSIPSWCRCLRVADTDSDGCDEVISGVDTNHRQLIVYGSDGEVRWDADLGGAVLAVEAHGGCLFAGAANGYVQCFDAVGARVWSRFLAEPVMGLAPDGAGGCRVALHGGAVVQLGADGEVTGSSGGAAETTVAACAPQWGNGVLLVGDEDGVVRCFG